MSPDSAAAFEMWVGREISTDLRETVKVIVPRVVNLSSSCVYPAQGRNPLDEDQILTGALEPTNEGYALAKIFAMRRSALRLVDSEAATPELEVQAKRLVSSMEESLRDAEEKAAREAERVAAETARIERERVFLERMTDLEMRQVQTGLQDTDAGLDALYRQAFEDFGIDLDDNEVGARIAELRDSGIAIQVALAADGWARLLRRMDDETRELDLEFLAGIGFDLDADEQRTEIRLAQEAEEIERLVALAEGELPEVAPADTLKLLASNLSDMGRYTLARRVVITGADRFPSDFELNFAAGLSLSKLGKDVRTISLARAEGYLRAALAIRPDLPEVYNQLAGTLRSYGNLAQAVRHQQQSIALAPDASWKYGMVGFDLLRLNRYEEALPYLERASDDDSHILAKAARSMRGELSVIELRKWVEEQAGDRLARIITLAYVLLEEDENGQSFPQRALDLIEEFYDSTQLARQGSPLPPDLFLVQGLALLRLGDAPRVLAAARNAQKNANLYDQEEQAMVDALLAVGLKGTGEVELAQTHWRRAEQTCAGLFAGSEQVWEKSLLANFYLEAREVYGR